MRDWRLGRLPKSGFHRTGSCPRCGHELHDFVRLPLPAYTHLLGIYLGDGCISTSKKGVHVLRLFQDMRPRLLPQYGPGRKHERRIALMPWQQELVDRDPRPLIRGLIHSDGCRVINRSMGRKYIRYIFSNASQDILGIFCAACDQVGIPWRQPKQRNISIARREGIEILDSFVGPKS